MKLRAWLSGLTLLLCWAIILTLGANLYQRFVQPVAYESTLKQDRLLHYDMQALMDNSFQCTGSMEVDKVISYDTLSRWCADAMKPYLKSLSIDATTEGIIIRCELPDDLTVLSSWLDPDTMSTLQQIHAMPIVIHASPTWTDGAVKLQIQHIYLSFYELPRALYQEASAQLEQQLQARFNRIDPCIVTMFTWQEDGLAIRGTFPHTIQ